nr:TusE/DsrC/DsvC family sulfur relay protein [Streptomyces sp. NBC_00886]
MPTATCGATAVPVDDEGFFTDPERWIEPMAEQIAHEAGIEALTDRHWTVIHGGGHTQLRVERRPGGEAGLRVLG